MPQAWKETFSRYRDIRLLWIFLMGCSSGFPFLLTGSILSGWLTDAGIKRAEVGLLGSVAIVYAINFLWAPLVDRVHLPLIGRLGQRRSWILVTQTMMLAFTLLLATVDPTSHLLMAGLFAFGIAASSATQDIAVDAFRIDQFAPHERDYLPPAAAIAIIGWWTGYSWPGYLAFTQADNLGWSTIYLMMAGVIMLLMLFTLLVREPDTGRDRLQEQADRQYQRQLHGHRWLSWVAVTVVEPFAEFFRKNGVKVALMLLLFIFLFKIGEAFLGRMSVVFYKEIGFSNEQVGEYTKLFGWFLTVSFTLLGSLFNTRFGIVKGLLLGGSAMAASNLMFAVLASTGPIEWLLVLTLVIDNFTTAFSTVAFVSFLTLLTGRAFSATQYALLASLGNLGRTTLAGLSGYSVDWLGSWERFFVVTALMVLPSLCMLWMLRDRFNGISENSEGSAHKKYK